MTRAYSTRSIYLLPLHSGFGRVITEVRIWLRFNIRKGGRGGDGIDTDGGQCRH